jgi:predicted transcriptional regulator
MDGSVAKVRRSFLGLACKVSSAYVTNNSATAADLLRVIAGVHGVFHDLANVALGGEVSVQKPAVSVRKSVTPDFLICLECGQKLKALKRHLVRHDQSPAGYRAKWQLPLNYPMVAANYTATRSRIAKDLGLGRRLRPADLSPPP